MEKELIQILGGLSSITIAAIVLIYVARTVFSRSKSDVNTIKVFADLLSGAFKKISEDVKGHGDESTTRHQEVVTVLQTVSQLLLQHVDTDKNLVQSMNELSDNVGTYTNAVKETGATIMDTVQPLDEILKEIRSELQELRTSVDAHLKNSTEFRDEVTSKTAEIETRLLQVEKHATPVIPKPKTEIKEEKT